MAKKKITIGSPTDIAEKLIALRGEMLAITEPLKGLKEKETELKEMMLEALKAARLEGLSTEYGINFTRATRSSLVVTDPKKALDWALKNDSVRIDTVKASKLLKGTGALVPGFEDKFTDYLSITGLTNNEE